MTDAVQDLNIEQLRALAQQHLGDGVLWWIEPTVTLASAPVVCMGKGGWPAALFDECWVWRAEAVAPPPPGRLRQLVLKLAPWLRRPASGKPALPIALHAVRRGAQFRARLCWPSNEAGGPTAPTVWLADAGMQSRHGWVCPAGFDAVAPWALQLDGSQCSLWLGSGSPASEAGRAD